MSIYYLCNLFYYPLVLSVDSNNDASLGEEEEKEHVSVSITTQAMNVQFKGTLQSVLKSTGDFFIKQFPEVDLARKISLNYDKDYLIEKYSSLIKISPEGVQVLVQLIYHHPK
jgi:hypothetical protein